MRVRPNLDGMVVTAVIGGLLVSCPNAHTATGYSVGVAILSSDVSGDVM